MQLSKDWLTEGLIDFEFKKYTLLSYFKGVKSAFNKTELYPMMADLIFHYNNLQEVKRNKSDIENRFPKKAEGIDAEQWRIIYEQIVSDSELMQELEEVVAFALPMFKNSLEEGKEIFEFVESQCELSAVGLIPLYNDEGYLFVSQEKEDIFIYRYKLLRVGSAETVWRGIQTDLVYSMRKSLGDTYENIKVKLIRKFNDLPNPATYLIHSKISFPYSATLMPIAKRLLIRHISMA